MPCWESGENMKYDEFFSTPLGKKIIEKEAKYVVENLDGKMAVSIGCGTGIIEKRIMELREIEIIGVEINDEMIEMAEKRLNVIKADAKSLPFKNSVFDSAIFITSLEFIDDYKEAINEAYRVLREGGEIISVLLNTSSPYFKKRYERNGYIRRNIKHLDIGNIITYITKKFLIEKKEVFGIENGEEVYGIKGKNRKS
ncbi:MAG TPA: class I SAM-dependent methyltransferase [Thermoplasmatales archaeon]|nr:class I SAM-dependent methyltransferase [Thermoplasmatales archaeon]